MCDTTAAAVRKPGKIDQLLLLLLSALAVPQGDHVRSATAGHTACIAKTTPLGVGVMQAFKA